PRDRRAARRAARHGEEPTAARARTPPCARQEAEARSHRATHGTGGAVNDHDRLRAEIKEELLHARDVKGWRASVPTRARWREIRRARVSFPSSQQQRSSRARLCWPCRPVLPGTWSLARW